VSDPLEHELRSASAPADDVEARSWRASVAERLFGRSPAVVAIGRYRVLERIGAGANGVVYAAIDPELDRKVAVKVLRSDRGGASPDALAREAKLLAKLSHPNVVPVYDVGVHEGRVFLTLELVEGTTLREWLAQPRPWRESVGLFAQAARGLAAAHAAGVVHRDFKPENALIGADGRVRVSDFGIARWLEAPLEDTSASPTASPRPSSEGSLRAGTPAYMAPEQFLGDPLDARTDQFSFCIALHEAIYGKRPFAGRDRATLAANVLAGRRRVPRDSACPRWLERAIARGLRTDPAERWPDMPALLAELEGDRRSPAARWVVAALLGASLAAAAIGLSERNTGGTDLCAHAGDRMADVWTDDRGAKIREAFAATGIAYADERGRRLVSELDRFADAWRSAQERACEGVDEALAVQRLYCLQSRLFELDSFASVLADADAEVVEFAVQSGSALRSPEDCLFIAAGPGAPAAAPAQSREASVADLRRTIARARAMGDAGKLRTGLELARDAARAAQDLADRSLEAEALLVAGAIESSLLGVDPGVDPATTIYAAVLAAEAAHRPDLYAQGLVDYVAIMVDRSENERARAWAPRARDAVAAIGDPPELAGRIDLALGLALGLENRWKESAVALRSAHDHFLRGGAASRRWLAVSVNVIAEMAFDRGLYLASRPDYERVIDLAVESFGPKHARVANGLGNLAETYFVLGDYAGAEPLFRQSLEIRREVYGDRSVWAVHSFAHVGDVLFALGRPDEALEHYERGLAEWLALRPAMRVEGSGVLAVYVDLQSYGQEAWLRNGIAQALVELGRTTDALAHAAATVEVQLPEDRHHPDLVARIDMRGQVLLELGRTAEALAHLETALARLDAVYPQGARATAWTLYGIGRARVDLGRADDAVEPLERALGLFEATPDADLRVQGRARFALARALWATGRHDPARAAARAAIAAFTRTTQRAADERDAVETWLSTRETDAGAGVRDGG
jgi:tetratricopeptide (TPR) repeat protein/predicted Ser/Thr protein kinase